MRAQVAQHNVYATCDWQQQQQQYWCEHLRANKLLEFARKNSVRSLAGAHVSKSDASGEKLVVSAQALVCSCATHINRLCQVQQSVAFVAAVRWWLLCWCSRQSLRILTCVAPVSLWSCVALGVALWVQIGNKMPRGNSASAIIW